MQTQYPIKENKFRNVYIFFIVWTNIQPLIQYLTAPLVAITTSSHLGYEYTGFRDILTFFSADQDLSGLMGTVGKRPFGISTNVQRSSSQVWLECLCGILPDLYTPSVFLDCFGSCSHLSPRPLV